MRAQGPAVHRLPRCRRPPWAPPAQQRDSPAPVDRARACARPGSPQPPPPGRRFSGTQPPMPSATHRSMAHSGGPAEPVEQEMQTARVLSKPGWDDSVLLSGTPRTSSPRAVHLPVRTAKRTVSTPGARRLSAWRSAKVRSWTAALSTIPGACATNHVRALQTLACGQSWLPPCCVDQAHACADTACACS